MIRFRNTASATLVCLAAATLAGCHGLGEAGSSYVERGDLDRIRERGSLRILLPPQEARTLPRRGDTLDFDLRLATELAAELGLRPVLLTVADRSRLLDALGEGRGDIAIARLTATPKRRARWSFSVPIDHVREVLVTRADDDSIRGIDDLAGREIAVRASSSFFETLRALRRRVPGIRIRTVGEQVDTEEILYRVARGEYDATIADEDLVLEVLGYRDDLRIAMALTDEQPIAWAMRPGSVRLKTAVDGFLQRQALTADLADRELADLDRIRERKVLRVLTRNNAATYFLYRGKQVGFEFELARRFAKQLGCRLRIVVPPAADQLLPWLLEGRGDVIAASLTVTPERQRRVAFSRPYNHVHEVLVARAADRSLRGPDDLAGRTVAVRRSSSYHETLRALQRRVDFRIVAAPEDVETEELIAAVAAGELDLTVADSNILEVELTYRDDVRGAFALGPEQNIAWAVRPDAVDLLRAVDEFLASEYRGTFYNVLQRKYFKNPKRVARLAARRNDRVRRLSPYDELFRRYGREVEIDWRLLAAQAYVESEFRPAAESWAGALGIMQVLPRTAREMGILGDLRDPETGIRAGATYLRHLVDRFEPSLPMAERLRFALGAYNAGRGHILDGRRLARERGLDPDRWFDNVEVVLPLLAKRTYARQARYGYCRCRQTREYVRRINDSYAAYSRIIR